MSKPHLKLELTPEQKRVVAEMRSEAEREKPDLLAEGLRVFAAHEASLVELRRVFSLLQAERKAQGLTLKTLAERTGISKPALSRLENDPAPNVQLTTLQRIAHALGKELRIGLANVRATRTEKPRRRVAAAP